MSFDATNRMGSTLSVLILHICYTVIFHVLICAYIHSQQGCQAFDRRQTEEPFRDLGFGNRGPGSQNFFS